MRARTIRASHRLCLVTDTYPPEINGVALTLARLARGLRERGHEVSVIRLRPAGTGRAGSGAIVDTDADATAVPGIPLPGYPTLRLGLTAARALRARWAARPPDVVYVATEGPLGWSAVSVARSLGIPALSGFHTHFEAYARHYRLGWLRPLVGRYLRHFHNRAAGTLVATGELGDALRERGDPRRRPARRAGHGPARPRADRRRGLVRLAAYVAIPAVYLLRTAAWSAGALAGTAAPIALAWFALTALVVAGRVACLAWGHGPRLALVWLVKLVTDPVTDLLTYTPGFLPWSARPQHP